MPYPEIIYKHRDWDNPLHKRVLLNNELYFASPKDFNDPFDFRITYNFSLLDTPRKREKYIEKIVLEFKESNSSRPLNVSQMKGVMNAKLKDLSKVQKEYEEMMFTSNNNHQGIICFSAVWNPILMWSHYANSHKGICIGFYEGKIKNFPTMVSGGMVSYQTDYPQIDPLSSNLINDMFTISHSKAISWRYECEYRINKLFYPVPPSNKERIFMFPDGIIAEVILGVTISEDNKRDIVAICRRKNISVYQAKKVPQKFNVTCVPVL